MSNGQNEASNYGQLEGIFQCSRWMERRNPSISRFSPARMYFLIASFVRDSIVDFLSTIYFLDRNGKWRETLGGKRGICSNACQWVCRAAVKLRHIGEDSLPSRRRREETIVRVDERKEARCDYSHAPPRRLPHRDSRQ